VRASEATLEKRVSEAVGEMRVLWLDVPDAPGPRSDRAYLERNIIGLLSRTALVAARAGPGTSWLGAHSSDWRIATSGLWNLDHLFYRPDHGFLDVLEAYVDALTPGGAPSNQSLAPKGWGVRQARAPQEQLGLFAPVVEAHGRR
jgi:hypothetical protein